MSKSIFANCARCNALFVKNSPTQKYCKDCKADVHREYNRVKKREYYDKIRVKRNRSVGETVDKHCKHKDCKYRGWVGGCRSCDYLLITGKLRDCNISECDKYESGKRDRVGMSLPRKEAVI